MIGPYLLDWTAYRQNFEREASAYLGRPVTIAGKASVRLLPTPVLSFTNVTVGDREAPDAQIERFHAEVELAPLLKGEVRIIEMSMERPHFRVDLARFAGSGSRAGPEWLLDPESVSLARLEIIQGTAELQDSRIFRSWHVTGIEAEIEAGSLRGPGRIRADLVLEELPLSVQAGFGRMAAEGTLPLNLSVSSPRYPVMLSAVGAALFGADAPPRYEGTVTVTGRPAGEEEDVPAPWASLSAAGKLDLTADALEVEEGQLSYGALARPLILEGEGRIDFGGDPRFDVSVRARQIDLDFVLGGGAEDPVAIEQALAAIVAAMPDLPIPRLPGTLHLDAQGVVVGGSVIQAVGADLAAAADGWQVEEFAAMLPGNSRVDVSGVLRTMQPPSFHGHARLASPRPAALAGWWRGSVGSAAVLERFSVEANLDLERGSHRLSGIVASTPGGTITGTIDLRSFSQQEADIVTVDLGADRADLVQARALAELLAGEDLSARHVEQMTLSLSADILSAGGVEARSVVVDASLEEGRLLQLQRFAVADLAGAGLEMRGTLRDIFVRPAGTIEASIEAEDIGGAARFLAGLLPDNRAVSHLLEMAPALSPVSAEVSAAFGEADAPLSLDLSGSFAGTHLRVGARGRGSAADPRSLDGTLQVEVDGNDSATVLRQIGLQPLPIAAGPVRLDLDFEGALASGGNLQVDATIAGVEMAYKARTALGERGVEVVGDVAAASADIDIPLLLAGLALPGLGEGHAAAASGGLTLDRESLRLQLREASFDGDPVEGNIEASFGGTVRVGGDLALRRVSLPLLIGFGIGSEPELEPEGGWSDTPFAAAIPDNLEIGFDIAADRLDLGLPLQAEHARLAFSLGAGALDIDLHEASFIGGAAKGTFAGTIDEDGMRADVRGSLLGAELQSVVWEAGGLPVASGVFDLSFDVSGGGRTLAGFVSSLAGSGSLAIRQGRINALNADALGVALQAAEADEAPDEEAIRDDFEILFGSGAFSFGQAAASLAIAGGVVKVPTVSVAAGGATVLANAGIDLNGLDLSSEWTVRAADAAAPDGSQPQVRLRFEGPLAAPVRTLDLNPLLALVNSRYLQRQLDRIEELEQARARAEAASQREEAARRRDALPPSPPPEPEPEMDADAVGPEASAAPGAGEAGAAPDVVDRLGAAIRDMVGGRRDGGLPPEPTQP